MLIMQIAQSCPFGNQAKIILEPQEMSPALIYMKLALQSLIFSA